MSLVVTFLLLPTVTVKPLSINLLMEHDPWNSEGKGSGTEGPVHPLENIKKTQRLRTEVLV